MKRLLIAVIWTFFFWPSFSQNTIELVKGERTLIIGRKDALTFYIKGYKQNGDSISSKYVGYIFSVKSDSIIIKPSKSSRDIYFKDKRHWQESRIYMIDTVTNISMNFNEIEKITKWRAQLIPFLSSISTISVITGAIIAPVLSMNFSNGIFDKRQYGKIVGASGAFFATSLTFAIVFPNKKFKINSSKDGWRIKLKS